MQLANPIIALLLGALVCVLANDPTAEEHHEDTIHDSPHSPAINNLTKAEKKTLAKQLKKILKHLDTDGDKHLSLKEIKRHLNKGVLARMEGDDATIRESAKKKAPKELRERDYDKDGYVTKEEMFRIPEWDPDFEEHQKHTFDLADLDKDGQLNVTEMRVFLHPEVSEYKQQYNEMVAQEHIDKVDSDHDGHITWEEHWHDVIDGHDFSKEQIEDLDETERELFNKHDGDSDGMLTRAELHDMLFPDLESIDFSGPQAAHVHDIADENDDGKLSLSELKLHAEMIFSNLALGGHDKEEL